ncbi:MAG: FkbM family methyltransferase [bacterium]
MSLKEKKKKYSEKLLDKWEYIDEMYKEHSSLFSYSEFLKDTNISGIEISDDKVIMTFRDSGVKFICVKNDKRLAPFDTLNFGSYETEELAMQTALIEGGQNIFDIGGNFGWYAIHIAKKFPNSKIFSFEPIPSTFKYLNENISLNGLTNVKTFNYGLSDEEGKFDFYFDPELSVNASLANVSGNENIQSVECTVKKLDNTPELKDIKIDFLKCDVEGAELLAFKGAMNSIKKNLPVIFTEMLRKWTSKFNYSPNDIIDLLSNLGYQCFTSEKAKLKAFDKVTESTTETNYFFLHREKHSDKIKKYLK